MIELIGENGYLGSYLKKRLDIKNDHKESGVVINCAGLVDVEECENDQLKSWEANVKPAFNAALNPRNYIIQMSSYYVYDDDHMCDELSKTTDEYVYMKHKLDAERFVLNSGGVVLRLGKLFGESPNPQHRLTEHIIYNNDVTLDKVWFNPTSLNLVYVFVKKLIDFYNSGHRLSGVYNVACAGGPTTHYDYGSFICKYLKKQPPNTIDKMSKPFHNYGRFSMDISKMNTLFITTPRWHDELAKYLDRIGGGACY